MASQSERERCFEIYVVSFTYISALQTVVIMEPLIYFRVCHGTPINKNLKTRITCKKIKYFFINKQLLQKMKIKKFNDSVLLAFLECVCDIQNFPKRTRISNVCRPIF